MRPLHLLLSLVLLVSCSDPEKNYQRYRAAAAQLPPAKQLGFKFRFGESSTRVAQLLDSLRTQKALQVKVISGDDTLRAAMKVVPTFAADRLVGLTVRFPKGELTRPIFLHLADSLRAVYGFEGERYFPNDFSFYWFDGGTQIEYGSAAACQCRQITYTTFSSTSR